MLKHGDLTSEQLYMWCFDAALLFPAPIHITVSTVRARYRDYLWWCIVDNGTCMQML